MLKESRSCSQNIVNTFDKFEHLRGQVGQNNTEDLPDYEDF